MALCLCFTVVARAQGDEDSTVQVEPPPPSLFDTISTTHYEGDQPFLKKYEYESNGFSVKERKVPDSLINKMHSDDDFWYADSAFRKAQVVVETGKPYTPVSQRSWFQTITWFIIIGGFATLLIIYLGENNIGLFRRKNLVTAETETEEIPENIFAINYQKEIDKAASQGNYRLAVRLMFLRLLRNMSEKNIIHYQQDKTNFDYLLQLQPTSYYTGFFRLTRNYEYSWYGQFDINATGYQHIKNDFDQFEKGLV